MTTRRISVVSFDVDGTLYDVRLAKARTALRYVWDIRFMVTFARARDALRGREFPAGGALREAAVRETARRLGQGVDATRHRANLLFDEAWPNILRGTEPFRGIRATLANLVARGVSIAVVSDYPATAKLAALGLAELPWAAVIDCEHEGALKPSPRGFHRLCELLNVAPADGIHVGDRDDHDGAAARAAGFAVRIVRDQASRRALSLELLTQR